MTATSVTRTPLRPRLQRGQIALAGVLLGLAALGWLVTDARMSHMDAGPGTDLGTLGFYTSAWVVMMAAMMFPSIVPMVLAYARVATRLPAGRRPGSTGAFVLGYLVSWMIYGLLAYGLFDLLRSLSIDELRWDRAGRYIAGAVIAAAALYQLTPAKDACLRRCRGPLEFLAEQWRPGNRGALRMGALHGVWCVGCCWALMAALFAVGVMSVGWMIFVAAIIAIEKLLPWRRTTSTAVALALLALALGVTIAPERVPGLTLPGSSSAHQAMNAMRR